MRATVVLVLSVLALAALPIFHASAGSGTPTFANFAAPSTLANNANAGEPSVGFDPLTNAAFFQAFTSTYKITFDANQVPTWSSVTPRTSLINFDPILFTDATTGRTYAGGLGEECSLLQYTDDDGATWIPMGNACSYPATDHESIASGAWHAPGAPTGAVYGRAFYHCAQTGTDRCATSTNGGLTFGLPVAIAGSCHSFHGHVKVSADGTAYVPNSYCGTHIGGGRTINNGASWASYEIANSVALPDEGFDPSVATTPDNTVYEAWAQGGTNHPMVARSTTHGASWDRVTDLASTVTPAITASTFQAAVAGDNGRVAVAYLGSTTGTTNPYRGGYTGVWDLYVSYSYDGGLTWITVKATSDPVQRGCVYDVVGSPSCHRNLLDFMDATLTTDGRVLVAYADGCVSALCVSASGTEASSSAAKGTIAIQTGGKGLVAAFD